MFEALFLLTLVTKTVINYKNESFFNSPQTLLVGRVEHAKKSFNDHAFYKACVYYWDCVYVEF